MRGPEKANLTAKWAGYSLDQGQHRLLSTYAEWLGKEALPAGGIGPDEARRVWDRHICDSLSFACGWPSEPPVTAIDLGSGVGLPGVPLGVLWPNTHFLLLDRSGRRIELLRRLIRVLDIENLEAVRGDIADQNGQYDGVVARGVMRPDRLMPAVRHLCHSTSRIVVGLSRGTSSPTTLPEGGKVVTVPAQVLDGGGQILIIDHCDD